MPNKNEFQKKYAEKVKKASPKSPLLKDCIYAFIFGGGICLLGEVLYFIYEICGASDEQNPGYVSVTLIALTSMLTGIGVFDKIAKYAGAGTMVPITGFANSVAAPAIEFSTEGRITGTAVKMFNIAGPVIVYGCSSAVIYGLIYYFFGR